MHRGFHVLWRRCAWHGLRDGRLGVIDRAHVLIAASWGKNVLSPGLDKSPKSLDKGYKSPDDSKYLAVDGAGQAKMTTTFF